MITRRLFLSWLAALPALLRWRTAPAAPEAARAGGLSFPLTFPFTF